MIIVSAVMVREWTVKKMPQCNNCIHNEVCITYADMCIKDALNITDKEIADFECEYYDNRDNVQQVVRCKDCEHNGYCSAREILFRGKRKDNREWIEGFYFKNFDKCYIFSAKYQDNLTTKFIFEVDPETVGQYTGLTDKNGKKTFEGDVVHAVYQSNYGGLENTDFGIGVVKYSDSYYGGAAYEIDIIGESGSRAFSTALEKGVTIIGNVWDNPELLKEE